MRSHRHRGSSALEAALFLPILFTLLLGMIEIARITYTYYTLHKVMYSVARNLGTARGADFCNDGDPVVTAAKNFALTGTPDNSADPALPNLTADMIRVRLERYEATSQDLGQCECSVTGCDIAGGARAPDYIVVYLNDGYVVRPVIPLVAVDPFALRPHVRVPFGGL
jgi:hypothetical protein